MNTKKIITQILFLEHLIKFIWSYCSSSLTASTRDVCFGARISPIIRVLCQTCTKGIGYCILPLETQVSPISWVSDFGLQLTLMVPGLWFRVPGPTKNPRSWVPFFGYARYGFIKKWHLFKKLFPNQISRFLIWDKINIGILVGPN